ncbi:hypothetical protein [Paraferrimonas sedimenticola]|uniref:Uncharacterized protein n=1 Tax=Paraferrimonas sedimenticola TaxID=375674 RepID=A0AA37W0W9_9GAMM|nr:hypothetical protein [Paraferrimonas sedimenticola]GLP96700.1 hypothetical protein GCM10007895_20060 [Paraferrimonas sedimenticola]
MLKQTKVLLSVSALALFLTACGSDKENSTNVPDYKPESTQNFSNAQSGIYAGEAKMGSYTVALGIMVAPDGRVLTTSTDGASLFWGDFSGSNNGANQISVSGRVISCDAGECGEWNSSSVSGTFSSNEFTAKQTFPDSSLSYDLMGIRSPNADTTIDLKSRAGTYSESHSFVELLEDATISGVDTNGCTFTGNIEPYDEINMFKIEYIASGCGSLSKKFSGLGGFETTKDGTFFASQTISTDSTVFATHIWALQGATQASVSTINTDFEGASIRSGVTKQ